MLKKKIYLSKIEKGKLFLDPLNKNKNKKNLIKLSNSTSLKEQKKHSRFCKKIVIKIIGNYFKDYNKNFQKKKNLNFFTIFYKPILTHLVESLYFKYVFLKKIDKKKFSIEKCDISNIKKIDIIRFSKLLRTSKNLNNAMISDISNKIGIDSFSSNHYVFRKKNSFSFLFFITSCFKSIVSFFSIGLSSIFYRKKILIHDDILKFNEILKILIMSKFKVSYLYVNNFSYFNFDSFTKTLIKEKKKNNSFEKICSDLLPKYLPEAYDLEMINKIHSYKVKKGSVLISKRLSDPANVKFRNFLGENIKNLRIFSAQHGGGYGYLNNFYLENYEKNISNKLLTWGWKKSKKDQPFSTSNLKINNKKMAFMHDKALLIGSNFCKYDYRFSSEPNSSLIFNNSNYINNKIQLIKEISKNYKLIYKPHEVNNWYDELIEFKKLKNFDIDKKNNLLDLAYNSKLIIICHLSTAFLESLSLNKPLILFLDKKFYEISNIAKKYFKLFEKVGLLHYNVNSIKNFLKKNNLEDWWSNNKLQEARQEFLKQFFNIKKNHDKNLLKYILKI